MLRKISFFSLFCIIVKHVVNTISLDFGLLITENKQSEDVNLGEEIVIIYIIYIFCLKKSLWNQKTSQKINR